MTKGFAWTLLAITLLGALLRLVKLGDYPGGFGQDEAVVLYDSWSLMTTGAEHHGERWPLNAREFGDYPSALPSYEIIPFVAALGPTQLAIRLPCALLNILAIPLFGLLAYHLFRSRATGLFAALLLAVSPWNLFFSRWAVSPGFVTFFQVAGLCLLIRLLAGQQGSKRVSGVAILTGFVLFLWTHQYLSQYFFAPFMIALAFLLWNRRNWPKILIIGGIYSLFMLLAIASRVHNPSTAGRLHRECIFFDDNIAWHFWHNYCSYLSFSFLFKAPQMLGLQQIPGVAHIQHSLKWFYLLGVVALVATLITPRRVLAWLGRTDTEEEASHWRKAALWVLAGFLLAPVVGALFTQRFYTARMTHMLTHILLVTALGCAVFWYALRRLPFRAAAPIFLALLLVYLGNTVLKTGRRLVEHNRYLKEYLQQGVAESLRYIGQQPHVQTVSLPRGLQGYIYHLLFTPVPPAKVDYAALQFPPQDPEQRWRYDRVPQLGNYYFDREFDTAEIRQRYTLRHQVRDADKIWYDLYERDGNWVVLPPPDQPLDQAPARTP